ncbi:pilus assembly protein TadG-related protein [Paraburkholderia guartelaensis]|uniref:pilus assembly protein TadG-related protein n=1 Tax=Paraburkholderia guartelaensis TaxID=2546446 RepID=UPI002AB63097|nr:pilus assembly protein TadG-related protein [Paraburkholderia guartelaensis]
MNSYPVRGRARGGQRGSVSVMVAVFLVVLLGCAALAIDVARWVIVRNELQNAADAAALAGARQLPGQLVAAASSTTWSNAATAATTVANTYAGGNHANGQSIVTPQTVVAGYWDVNAANQPSTVPSSLPQTIGSPTDKPAVMVTVSLDPTHGTGLPLLLGRVLGVSSLHASATAVAIISAPGAAQPGSLFPMALNQCLYSNSIYWSNGQPVSGAELQMGVGANMPQGSNCQSVAGQWTTLNNTTCGSPDSTTSVNCLMNNGNSDPLSTTSNANTPCAQQPDSCTFISPGTKAAIYNNFPLTPPMLVTVPIVADGATNLNGVSTPILGFASYEIDAVIGANNNCTGSSSACANASPPCTKCILGHLVSGIAGGTTAGGTTTSYYGAVTPPTLAGVPSSEWY